jgi:hypothetical protein
MNKMNKRIEIDNVVPSPKRRRVNEETVTPCKKQRCRRVTWAEDPPQVHVQGDWYKLFSDYDQNDIWYTVRYFLQCLSFSLRLYQVILNDSFLTLQRDEYSEFSEDRLRTVQCLRASGGNEKALDPEFYCIRGLEPFQTPDVHRELHSKRHFHQSTIMIEQVRQSMLGIRDPERFRFMVEPQSEMSLRRAQELAALDEHEVYNRVCRRRSLMAPQPKSLSSDPMALSLSDRVRRLQEWNARRLMEIYSQPGNGPFRFNIRRDSLVGSSSGGMESIAMGTRFPIRRDSLTPLSADHR